MKKTNNYTQNLLTEMRVEKPFNGKKEKRSSRDDIIKRAKTKLTCDGERGPCIVSSRKQFIYPPLL